MTIASELLKLQNNLDNSYTACENKGATLPASQNFDNLASTISAIPATTEPTLASLTVTPSTTAQTITPPSGTDGYNTVIASAVTASIDSDIVSGNIKSGVNILGVNGSLTELKGEKRTVSITSTSGNTFTPSSGKNGITSIKCNPKNKALTITPSKTSQTKTVPSNYSGYGTVKCNAVTSSIDSNITAGNIKSGVTILGVTGTYEGSGGGGGGGDIAIPHIKIIRATSWEVVGNSNYSGIDFNNIVTDNADNLPYLMFSPEDLDYPDEDWVLTGGFFMSAMRNSFAAKELFCPGISVGSFSSQTWYGMTFGDYGASYLSEGYGIISYWFGSPGTNSVDINVTWDVPS